MTNRTPELTDMEAQHTRGSRFAIALVSWCLAGIGVLFSLFLAGGAIASPALNVSGLLLFVPLFAWLALAVMTVRWVQNRRCHWLWPVAGTAAGVISAAFSIWMFFVYFAAVPLAIYLVFWHLRRRAPANSAA